MSLRAIRTPVLYVLCPTPELARHFAELPEPNPEFQARLDELAEKANEGTLSSEEASEYDKYVEYGLRRSHAAKSAGARRELAEFVMDDESKAFVRQRVGNRWEYCRIHQRYYPDFTFHVEHIVARQHRGSDDPGNLALACHLCITKKVPTSPVSTQTLVN